MSKKIIPIVTLLGASALIVGINMPESEKKENISSHIDSFSQDVSNYVSANANLSATALNKYTLSLQENLDDIPSLDALSSDKTETNNETPKTTTVDDNNNIKTSDEIDDYDYTENIDNENEDNDGTQELEITPIEDEELSQISTLYSLSNDIESSCGEFCELKEQISNAIIETQNLIEKVQNNEIELNNEQRLFITEQAQQLKNLGRQLSSITTELSFNLSDLSQLMKTNNQNIDNLSLKYLVVLDNLVNGNEMLESGLSSLNLINQMFNMRSSGAEPNNHGRILYGFQHNNNPPVIKDYYIDENGNVVENNIQNENDESQEENVTKNANIDTYKNSNLTTNLDTYNNSNLNHNIDSFFNTALLDNEFMYGNNYGYGMNGYANPYMNHYQNYEKNTTSNGANQGNNTQNDVDNQNQTNQNNKEKKRFKLKKNIDTFKDENEPSIKTKLGNIKNSITNFFSKSKKMDLNDKIDNPIYRYKASNKD